MPCEVWLTITILDTFTDLSHSSAEYRPFLALKKDRPAPFTVFSRNLALIGSLFLE